MENLDVVRPKLEYLEYLEYIYIYIYNTQIVEFTEYNMLPCQYTLPNPKISYSCVLARVC